MALQIPCPKCGAELKLRDRSLLGKTGKCPKCGHRFTLAEPGEVELELATPAAEEPVRVAAARRVLDERAATIPVAPQSVATEPSPFGLPVFTEAASPPSSVEVLRGSRRGPSRRAQIVLGGLLALVAVAIGWASLEFFPGKEKVEVAKEAPPQADASYASGRDRLERMAALIAADSPTKGEPITLRYVPAGTSVVIHLHPAALWKADTVAEETRYCLGDDFMAWADAQISKYCLFPPAEVEEATICLILGPRGSEPQVATVVRPATPLKRSQLIEKFAAQLPKAGESVYVGEERAFIFGSEEDAEKRPLVFASAPKEMADDLTLSLNSPGLTSEAIRRLLEKTDRQRHFTAVFQPAELRIHEETLARQDLRPLWNALLDRFEDVEAAAWSIHFAGGDVVSEFVLRNDPTVTPNRLHGSVQKSLDTLPGELLAAASKMNPASIGRRKVIGRFPAMAELFAASTVGGIGDRFLVLQTRLPERAGPNLALASLLAWDESTRTDFQKPATGPGTSGTPAETLAERLKKPIEIDFRRTPLEEAFAYIGGETGVEFEVDGDALKFAGYTRNMPQTFNLGRVPAEQAIAQILKPPQEKLAVVLDEANRKAVVTTKAVAEEKGLTPASFAP